MNETATSRSSKPPQQPLPPSSSLVVAEKRPRRPAGCAGIFFRLYDWNRKFAKKLSTKVLAPAPSNKAYKKFRGHEKMPMPKLLLIAGENSGGFPNAKKNGYFGGGGGANVEHRLQNHKMRSASLVARLMGLESMPLVQREKHCLPSEALCLMDENFASEQKGSDEETISSENPKAKNEARPQKLQKTEPPERCPAARIGAEGFQYKGVLPCSKKHSTKFVSPLKTHRSSSGRTAQARLVDAAARILEPGLQAKSRGKCALTYFNHTPQLPDNEVMPKGQLVRSPDLSKQSECYGSGAESSKGMSSCKACGTPLASMDSRTITEEDHPVPYCSLSGSVNAFSQDFGSSNRETTISASEQKMDPLFQKRQGHAMAPVAQVKDYSQNSNKLATAQKPPSEEAQTGWSMASQQWKRQNDASLSGASKHRLKSQVPLGKNRFPPGSKPNNLEVRRVSSDENAGPNDFVVFNGSLSVGTKQKMSSKGNYSKLVTEAYCNEQENPFRHPRTLVHKRRTTNVGGQSVNKVITGSTSRNQRTAWFESTSANNTGLDSSSVDRGYLNGKINNQGDSCTVHSKSSDESFMFSSPPKHKARVVPSKETGRNTNYSFSDNSYQQKRFILDENGGKMPSHKQFPQRDALGAFLVQKLAKLAHQEHGELEGSLPERSKAMILEELISVVSKEMPISPKERMVQGDQKFDYINKREESSGDRLWHDTDFGQTEVKRKGTSVQFQEEGAHFSPGSVLHASLSIDSCLSSSLDNSSLEEKNSPAEPGARVHRDPMDCSINQSLGPDSVFSDSATSLDGTVIDRTYILNQLFNHISGILYSMNDVGARLTESKLNYAEEVIFNAELLFGNAAMSVPNGTDNFLLGPALLDKLECLARLTFTGSFLSFGVTKEYTQFRTFLLDSVIEYLDLKNTRYYKSGFRPWRRLPLSMSREMLICEVSEEITRWTHLAGKLPDEIIDCEMSHSLGKWTDFEIEEFEIGAEVGSAIFHFLIDEITMDIHQCRLGTP